MPPRTIAARRLPPRHAVFLVSALFVAATEPAKSNAADWPHWMGPHRDNTWREDGILERFPEAGPKVLWRVPVAGGYAGPAVVGGRVFVTDYVTEDDVQVPNFEGKRFTGSERVLCLDATNGQQIWKHEYPVKYSVSYPGGPRCTPIVEGGRVWTLGTQGHLHAFNAENGEVLWSKDLTVEYGAKPATWGYAAHPLIDGERLITLVGGEGSHLVAFHKETGKEIWRALTAVQQGYAPPTIVEAGGVRQLITVRPDAVSSVDPATGKEYWSVPYEATSGSIIMSPILAGDLLYVAGYSNKNLLLRLSQTEPTAEIVWRDLKKEAVSPVNVQPFRDGETLYGVGQGGTMYAVDIATGKRLWSSTAFLDGKRAKQVATAFIVRQGDRYFLHNDAGELIIAKLSRDGYEEVDRAKILDPTSVAFGRRVVWSMPAFAGRCLYARNDKELVCVDLSATPTAATAEPGAEASAEPRASAARTVIKPLRALLITGGCCHQYAYQARKLVDGSMQRASIVWTVEQDPRRGTRGKIELYEDPDWAKPYDVVVHNECFAATKDPEYVRKITDAHAAGVPAVVIHCAMHTYRSLEIDDWRRFLGVTSRHHEHQSEYDVKLVAKDHPIMADFPDVWKTPRDELYVVEHVWPGTTVLATTASEKNGAVQPVFWTNRFGKARVFGTTYGHGNATFDDPVFIDTVTRGLLWAAGKLTEDGEPALGYAGAADWSRTQAAKLAKSEERVELFNRYDLTGWQGDAKLWSVVDGNIVGKNEGAVPTSSYLFTEKSYREFRLLFGVRQVVSPRHSTMHSAVAVLGERIDDKATEKEGSAFGFKGPLLMFCKDWGIWDAHRRNRVFPEGHGGTWNPEGIERSGDWNHIEVLVKGNRIRMVANGRQVIDFTDDEAMLRASPIGLQLHSNRDPQEFRFRGFVLTEKPEDRLLTLE